MRQCVVRERDIMSGRARWIHMALLLAVLTPLVGCVMGPGYGGYGGDEEGGDDGGFGMMPGYGGGFGGFGGYGGWGGFRGGDDD